MVCTYPALALEQVQVVLEDLEATEQVLEVAASASVRFQNPERLLDYQYHRQVILQ